MRSSGLAAAQQHHRNHSSNHMTHSKAASMASPVSASATSASTASSGGRGAASVSEMSTALLFKRLDVANRSPAAAKQTEQSHDDADDITVIQDK